MIITLNKKELGYIIQKHYGLKTECKKIIQDENYDFEVDFSEELGE